MNQWEQLAVLEYYILVIIYIYMEWNKDNILKFDINNFSHFELSASLKQAPYLNFSKLKHCRCLFEETQYSLKLSFITKSVTVFIYAIIYFKLNSLLLHSKKIFFGKYFAITAGINVISTKKVSDI